MELQNGVAEVELHVINIISGARVHFPSLCRCAARVPSAKHQAIKLYSGKGFFFSKKCGNSLLNKHPSGRLGSV